MAPSNRLPSTLSIVLLACRLLELTVGLGLIVVGAGLFVILTAELNKAQSIDGPMNLGLASYWPIVLVLDVIFVSLVYGGVKLAGFGSRVFGAIIIVAGLGILSLGIWHHVTGPPIDYDSSLPETNLGPVVFELNLIVYFWAGVAILGGSLLTVFATRATSDESSAETVELSGG